MSRLVMQNWSPLATLRAEWPEEEARIIAALRGIGGVSVLSLEPGAGLVEVDDRRHGMGDRIKRQIEAALPGWKVYEETTYSLPAVG